MTDHTDPIRLVLSLEQLRDPIIKAMGLQLSLKDREIAIANKEISDLRKRVSQSGPSEKIPTPVPKPVEDAEAPTTPPDHPEKPKPAGNRGAGEPWVVAYLRANGPSTIEMLMHHRGCQRANAQVALSMQRAHVVNDGKRPRTYWLK